MHVLFINLISLYTSPPRNFRTSGRRTCRSIWQSPCSSAMAERKTCGSQGSRHSQEGKRTVKKIALYVSFVLCIVIYSVWSNLMGLLLIIYRMFFAVFFRVLNLFDMFWPCKMPPTRGQRKWPAHSCPAPCALGRGCSQQASGFGLSAFQRVQVQTEVI